MKWIAFASTVALFFCWITNIERTDAQRSFVVYDQRDGFVASILDGRDLTVFGSADSTLRATYITSKIEKHERFSGASSVIQLGKAVLSPTLNSSGGCTFSGGRIKSDAFDVLFLSERNLDAKPLRSGPDVLVLHDMRFVDDDVLLRHAMHASHLVTGGGLPWRARRSVADWCEAHAVRYHDIRREGAFILDR